METPDAPENGDQTARFARPNPDAWYAVPTDPTEIEKLRRSARAFANEPDTPNLYALYLLHAIDELVWLRAEFAAATDGS